MGSPVSWRVHVARFGIRTMLVEPGFARALVQLAGSDQPPRRWIAGADPVAAVEQNARDLLAQTEAHRDLSSSRVLDV